MARRHDNLARHSLLRRIVALGMSAILALAGMVCPALAEVVIITGDFYDDEVHLTIGDISTVQGEVMSTGSNLNRVTYQIEGWYGDDENNRYCTQSAGGDYVNLSGMQELVLDTTRAPLNQAGTYTLWLVASTESGDWDKLDCLTIYVEEAYVEPYPAEPAHSEEEDWSDPADNDTSWDEYGDDSEWDGQDDAYMPAAELRGEFAQASITLKLGDVTRVEGRVGSKNYDLAQVTYQIEGWYGTDENNRYCTQAVYGTNQVDLMQMSDLLLNTNDPPLNQPGEYTLWVVARAEDGSWDRLDSMQVIVVAGDPVDVGSQDSEPIDDFVDAGSQGPAHSEDPYDVGSQGPAHSEDPYDVGSQDSEPIDDFVDAGSQGPAHSEDPYDVGSQGPGHSEEVDVPEPSGQIDYLPATELKGYFTEDNITLTVGDVTRVEGKVGCKNGVLAQVTYQIDGWYGTDENNRYCTQAVSGVNQVDLAQMSDLVLDASRAPLNQPGEYTLWVVARAEDGSWDRLDSMQVIVVAGDPVDVGSQGPADSEEVVVPEPSGQIDYLPATELKGYFTEDNITLTVGDVTRVEGKVGCKNGVLAQVTYQIDGWYGTDENNRYCTQAVSGVNQVDLAQMNDLVLDASRAPLNQPGEYTLWVVARAEDGSWDRLDSMQVIVVADDPVDVDSQGTADSEEVVVPEPSDQIDYLPATELKGYFTEDNITLTVGDVTRVEGKVGCKNGVLAQVTYQIEGWNGTDENNRYCTQAVSGVNQVDLAQMSDLVLDASRAPLNQPGEYTLRLVARAADGSWSREPLDTLVIHVQAQTSNDVVMDQASYRIELHNGHLASSSDEECYLVGRGENAVIDVYELLDTEKAISISNRDLHLEATNGCVVTGLYCTFNNPGNVTIRLVSDGDGRELAKINVYVTELTVEDSMISYNDQLTPVVRIEDMLNVDWAHDSVMLTSQVAINDFVYTGDQVRFEAYNAGVLVFAVVSYDKNGNEIGRAYIESMDGTASMLIDMGETFWATGRIWDGKYQNDQDTKQTNVVLPVERGGYIRTYQLNQDDDLMALNFAEMVIRSWDFLESGTDMFDCVDVVDLGTLIESIGKEGLIQVAKETFAECCVDELGASSLFKMMLTDRDFQLTVVSEFGYNLNDFATNMGVEVGKQFVEIVEDVGLIALSGASGGATAGINYLLKIVQADMDFNEMNQLGREFQACMNGTNYIRIATIEIP